MPKTITDDASAPRSVLGPGLEDANAAYVAAVQARLAQTADLDKAENKARVKEKHLKGRVKDRNDRLELEGSEEDGSSDSGLSEEEESEGETDQSDDDEEEEMDEDEDEEDEESDEEFVSSSVATSSKRRRTEDKAPSKRRKREEVAAVGSIHWKQPRMLRCGFCAVDVSNTVLLLSRYCVPRPPPRYSPVCLRVISKRVTC